MSSLDLFRTIKIKSVENAIYNRSYNRCRFLISPDDMATDLSQSYLAFKLFIINGKTGVAYTPNEIRNLEEGSIMFSFGQNDEAYSPACLIKTARLYALGNQSEILEEINYSNVLSQTLFQLKNDFETLASESLLTMSSTGMFLNGSLPATASSYFGSSVSSANDGSVQVNIKLHDLFGVCKSTNFWLSQTNGLEVYLEFEDVKPLIRQSCVYDLSVPLPNSITSSLPAPNTKVTGYKDDYSSNHYPYSVPDQNKYALSNNLLSDNSLISTPQCYRFDKSYYNQSSNVDTADLVVGSYYKILSLGGLTAAQWQSAGTLPKAPAAAVMPTVGTVFKCISDTATTGVCLTVNSSGESILIPGSKSNLINILPTFSWDNAALSALGLVEKAKIKVVFKIQQPAHVDRLFEHISEIAEVGQWLSVTQGPVITLNDYFQVPILTGTYLSTATITFDSFEILPNSDRYMFEIASWNTLVTTGILPAVGKEDVEKLQLAGVLSGGYLTDNPTLSGGNTMFNYAVNMRTSDTGNNVVSIYPDIVKNGDVASLRGVYSNQSKKLPLQTGTVRVVKAVPNTTTADTFDLHFDTMGLVNNNSLQAVCLLCPENGTPEVIPGLGVETPATYFDLIAFNTKIPFQLLPTDQMVVGEWYGVTTIDNAVDWTTSGSPVANPAVGVSFQCTAPLTSVGTVVWCHPNKYNGGNVDKSWQITKSELVLVQHMKDPQMPPSMIYSTYKVEAATIENNSLTEYNRQFIIGPNDRNCFNVLLCTPHYTGENQSLISKSRNINQYRFSVNNIDNTNRNIGVRNNTSFYPSSLHLDKLFDTMRNDVGMLKSLSGINGVSRSFDPPAVFPLKVYTASDAENQYLSPMSSLTVQFAAYGDSLHNQFIEAGPIFFFKQMFRVLPPVPFK
jgi:hypothetical protein